MFDLRLVAQATAPPVPISLTQFVSLIMATSMTVVVCVPVRRRGCLRQGGR